MSVLSYPVQSCHGEERFRGKDSRKKWNRTGAVSCPGTAATPGGLKQRVLTGMEMRKAPCRTNKEIHKGPPTPT